MYWTKRNVVKSLEAENGEVVRIIFVFADPLALTDEKKVVVGKRKGENMLFITLERPALVPRWRKRGG